MRTEDRTDPAYRNALIQQERTGAGIWDLIVAQMDAMRDEIDRHERLRVIGQRVVNAHRERRKVVRVADMMGGES